MSTISTTGKVHPERPGLKAEGVGVVRCLLIACLLAATMSVSSTIAQELPSDEIQVNLSSYFDNFNVQIVYPNIAYTRKVSEKTSMTGRYLIDVVSAASIRGETPESEGDDDDRSRQVVDVVTSASGRNGEPQGPDDLRD